MSFLRYLDFCDMQMINHRRHEVCKFSENQVIRNIVNEFGIVILV